ncbi:PEGA domain-containing protein [Haliangium sp.]|uniref:PEGA domain-containing protein n=1 Tax=Haliangium sp. TaxID=2663208 RepID=UPI003D14C86F
MTSTDFSGTRPPAPPSGGSGRTILLVVAAFVVVNAIGLMAYRVVKSQQDRQPTAEQAVAAEAPTAATAPPGATADGSEALIRANRAAGLQAFEDGDYDLAVEKLHAAAQLGGAGDIPELLLIAKEMQDRAHERASSDRTPNRALAVAAAAKADEPQPPAAAEPAPTPAESKPATTERPARRPVRRRAPARSARRKPSGSESKPETAAAEPEEEDDEAEDEPGVLLVTSTPSKLVVLIDDKQRDLTPAKLNLPPGSYRVALAREGKVLYSRSVTIEAGEVSSVNRDLSEKLAALEPSPSPAREQPAPVTPPPAEREVARPPPPPKRFGELYIISPNVYGEIYINGQKRGFPPLVVKDIPVGVVRVEVKVQGETRRAKTVRVSEDERTQVRFR